jgi:hypothetical protein
VLMWKYKMFVIGNVITCTVAIEWLQHYIL